MASSRSSRTSGGTPADAAAAMARRSPAAGGDDDGRGEEGQAELRRGPWTVDEDLALVNYITDHGEGRWNSLAQAAGLKRTGKSCRLRWLNYLRPDVKRGNFTADEQLLILDLHSRYGNRWSKIAQHLPGRTDNEIKNYWRTRVQKHAKQLNCDANSARFKDAMRFLWMPHLVHHHHHFTAAGDHQDNLLFTAASFAGGGGDVHAQLSGVGGVTSSSSDSFATTTSESYDTAVPPKTWEPYDDGGQLLYASNVRAGEMMAANGGGGDWMHETNRGTMWCDNNDQKAQADGNYNGGGGQVVEDAELSGWVQSFSEGATENFWTLEDICWKMQ